MISGHFQRSHHLNTWSKLYVVSQNGFIFNRFPHLYGSPRDHQEATLFRVYAPTLPADLAGRQGNNLLRSAASYKQQAHYSRPLQSQSRLILQSLLMSQSEVHFPVRTLAPNWPCCNAPWRLVNGFHTHVIPSAERCTGHRLVRCQLS